MKKKLKFILLILLLTLSFLPSKVEAIAGHTISNLRLSTDPVRPNVSEAFTLNLSFNLKSPSGIQFNRIKIRQNDTLIDTVAADFGIERISPTEAFITFSRTTFMVTGNITNTKITVNYRLTSDPESKSLASRSINLRASNPQGNNNSGGKGGGGGGGGKNAIPKTDIVRLDAEIVSEEVTEDEVSLEPKQFRITIDHSSELIPGEEQETYDQEGSQLLQSLNISRIDRSGNRTNFSDGLDIELERTSRSSPGDSSLTETVFITEGKIFTEAQSFDFDINVNPFLKSVNVRVDRKTSNIKDSKTIIIRPRNLDLNSDPDLSFTSLFFEPRLDANTGEVRLSSEDFQVTANTTTTEFEDITVDALGFVTFGTNGTTLPSLEFDSNLRRGSAGLNGSGDIEQATVSNNGDGNFTFNFPGNLFLDISRAEALRRRELFSTNSQKLNIPVSIFTKDADELDVSFTKTIDKTVSVEILDDPIFTNANISAKANKAKTALRLIFRYSNYVGKNVDPLDLEIDFLDSTGTVLGTSTLRSFSKIKDKSGRSKGTVSAVKRFRKTLRDEDLEGGLSTLLAQAEKVKIRIRRDASYLNSFGLSYDADADRESLLFNTRNEKEITIK